MGCITEYLKGLSLVLINLNNIYMRVYKNNDVGDSVRWRFRTKARAFQTEGIRGEG